MVKKCYFCGCVRNCANYLIKVFDNINEIATAFDEYKIVIAYDISNDNSLQILLDLKKKYLNVIDIKIIVNKNQLSKLRTFNISNARNSIIQYLKDLNDPSYEFFVMMDMDDVCSKLIDQPNVLQKYLDQENWDSISFNRNNYYDIWAISIKPYFLSCWHFGDITFSQKSRKEYVNIIQTYITHQLNALRDDELLVCLSAFNGFAIYKTKSFLNCTYQADIRNHIALLGTEIIKIQELKHKNYFRCHSIEDCEHKCFHLQAILKNDAKIRISPLHLFHD
jgi:hypothetical protein